MNGVLHHSRTFMLPKTAQIGEIWTAARIMTGNNDDPNMLNWGIQVMFVDAKNPPTINQGGEDGGEGGGGTAPSLRGLGALDPCPSCLVLSCLVLSCLVLSYRVLSCCLVLSRPVLSCLSFSS